MTYGLEIKNRLGKTIIGEVQNRIERVSYGTARVKVPDASLNHLEVTEEITLGVGKADFGYQYNAQEGNINFPAGVNQGNILIFARPQFNEEVFGPIEDIMPLACWPMSVVIQENNFGFYAPDATIDYYSGARGDYRLPISNSKKMFVPGRYRTPYSTQQSVIKGYDTTQDVPLCEVYYEIWRVDAPVSVSADTHGLEIFRNFQGTQQELFSTNRRQFQADIIVVESTGLTATPFTASVDGFWQVDDSVLPILEASLPSVSAKANADYLTLMNVTAGLAAFSRGGSYPGTESYEAPNAPNTAYFKRFIEWHYGGGSSGRPFVRSVPRLAYNLATDDTSLYPDIRYNNDLGETPSIVIGTTS